MDIQNLIESIVTAVHLLKKPLQETAGRAISDCYEAVKTRIGSLANDEPAVTEALAGLESRPDSAARASVLIEELEPFDPSSDKELKKLCQQLKKALKAAGAVPLQQISIQQSGKGSQAFVAGRDIVHTQQVKKKTEFTPGEQHITPEQGRKIQAQVKKLAEKLRKETGEADFSAAYSHLNSKMGVTTYKEILREDFELAMSELKQANAINRGKLRRSNPTAYKEDLYTAIYAKTGPKGLNWPKTQVYDFAKEKLELKKSISSLKQLGPNQLKHLNEYLQREVNKRKEKDSGFQ